jgi:hypothetical protein
MRNEDLEFSDYGRECNPVVRGGVWAACIAVCVSMWIPVLVYVVPVLRRLLQ